MSSEKIVNELYKFLREDVTTEKLFEADKVAYPVEGKLPTDPSLIKDPEKDIQLLSEEEKKKDKGEVAPAPITDEPAETEVEEEMEEKTPEVEELTQDEETGEAPEVKAADAKVKDEKKIEPKVTSVEKVKEATNKMATFTIGDDSITTNKPVELKAFLKKHNAELDYFRSNKIMDKDKDKVVGNYSIGGDKTDEGKLPNDPSLIINPDKDIQTLAEETVLTTVSDEIVAKDISSKYPNSRIVVDNVAGKKQFIIMVKEVQADKGTDKLIEAKNVNAYKATDGYWYAEVTPQGSMDAITFGPYRTEEEFNAIFSEYFNSPGAGYSDPDGTVPPPRDPKTLDGNFDYKRDDSLISWMQTFKATDGWWYARVVPEGGGYEDKYYGKWRTEDEFLNVADQYFSGSDGDSDDSGTLPPPKHYETLEEKIKEVKTTEPKDKKVVDKVPQVKAEGETDKLTKECTCGGNCKTETTVEEDVNLTITTDDKEIQVSSVDGGTQVTTIDLGAQMGEEIPIVGGEYDSEELPIEEPTIEPEIPSEEEIEVVDDDMYAMEMAEKLFVVEHLNTKKKLSEKEIKFIADVNAIKLSEKQQVKVNANLEALKKGQV